MGRHDRESHHFLKIGNMLVSLDLCILNRRRNENWFQDRHRQEVVAVLQEAVSEKIREYYDNRKAAKSRKFDKEAKPKAEEPKMLQGSTVKIGYKFIKRLVTQRCLLTKSRFETIRLFPEKLYVYVCEYHPSTVLQATTQLLNAVCKDGTPDTVGISNYFPSTSHQGPGRVAVTTSAVKKRNKLKKIVQRANHGKPVNTAPCTLGGCDTIAEISDEEPWSRETGESEQLPRSKGNEIENATIREYPRSDDRLAQRLGEAWEHDTVMSEIKQNAPKEMLMSDSVTEQVKKRRRSQDWDQGNLSGKNTAVGIENRKQAKRQKTEEPCGKTQSGKIQNASSSLPNELSKTSATGKRTQHVVPGDEVVVIETKGEDTVNLCEDDDVDVDVCCLTDCTPDPENVSMLGVLQLQRLLRNNKKYLKEIFIGKRPCKRHLDYKHGGSSRANLVYEAWYGPFTEEQVDCIMGELVKIYCANNNKYFDYISKVLLPEALTKICMDVLKVSLEEAQKILEKTPLCGDSTMLGGRPGGGSMDYSIPQY